MVRCAGAIYPWSAAATFVLGAMVFGTCWQHLLPPGTPQWSSPEALQAAAQQQQGGASAQVNLALAPGQAGGPQAASAGGSGGTEQQKKVRGYYNINLVIHCSTGGCTWLLTLIPSFLPCL
jgi:hypothetical protein